MTLKIAGGLLMALALQANAAEFKFDANNSQLGFTGYYDGEAVPGVFKQFSGTASFDLGQPLATRFTTDIDVARLDTDYADRDDTLRSADFFDSAQFPTARWVSSGECSASSGSLTCPGSLTLKGQTHPVTLAITPADDGKSLQGKASFTRSAFGIGTGDWADPKTIADNVEVTFKLQLQ